MNESRYGKEIGKGMQSCTYVSVRDALIMLHLLLFLMTRFALIHPDSLYMQIPRNTFAAESCSYLKPVAP